MVRYRGPHVLLPGEESAEPHTLLQDAVLVFSGYQNPLRAELRNLALSMGARVRQDWGPGCTHLMCVHTDTCEKLMSWFR